MIDAKGSNRVAVARRLPLAARTVIARLRRPPALSVHPWTDEMTTIAIAAFAVSICVALVVDPYAVDFVRDHRRTAVIRWLASVTDLGKSGWYLVPAGLAVIALTLADWTSRTSRTRARFTTLFGLSAYIFASIALSGLLVNLVKLLVGRGRPAVFYDVGSLSFRPYQFTSEYLSYPSGHSTTAGAVALVLLMLAPRLRILVLALTGLVAFSRVAAFAHYPGDVIAGFGLGFLFSLWLARWLAARGLVFQVVDGMLLPVFRHRLAWRSFLRNQ